MLNAREVIAMKRMSQFTVVVAAFIALAGCGKKEAPPPPPPAPAAVAPAPDLVNVPASVRQVVLGSQIGADKKVAAPASSFAPADTIYAVIETIGSGKASVKAVWTYHKGDKTAQVNETTQELALTGPAANEFHISKPGGWPAGDYQVEVFLNGASVDVRKFAVK
jgi:predicted small lipoprotein YifL